MRLNPQRERTVEHKILLYANIAQNNKLLYALEQYYPDKIILDRFLEKRPRIHIADISFSLLCTWVSFHYTVFLIYAL